ncbi:MAG: acetate/propionate family kinase [Leucobacter sp.]
MQTILVINAGSSSIKYQLIEPATGERLAKGLVERIGESDGRVIHHSASGREESLQLPIPDHEAGFSAMIEAFGRVGAPIEAFGIAAVGHRVVQGGSQFVAPTLIDDEVAERILALGDLAPLHNPGEYQGIVAAREMFSDVPHVAVFDTAFHQSMPPEAYTYAIDAGTAEYRGVRRYGFHGTSYQVVSQRTADFLDRPLESLRQIVLHLGNGASACAIDGGRSVDTSMGFTPLEGLVMGTRGGDIDPGALLHLMRGGYSVDDLDRLLNNRSGLLGLSGSNDMRDVASAADRGDAAAKLAFAVYVHRIHHYLGAYLVLLGGTDAIVFTAGVGENQALVRARACEALGWLGVRLDPERNEADSREARRISADDSSIEVLVVPTDEEAEIARQTWELASIGG